MIIYNWHNTNKTHSLRALEKWDRYGWGDPVLTFVFHMEKLYPGKN